jgi:SAM-dependent methyltransferase
VEPHDHWERIYTTRPDEEVGWFERDPSTSVALIQRAVAGGARSVVDVGGGASRLVDRLLDLGLDDMAVLDISEAGLDIAKRRLGDRAAGVRWIVADVTRIEDIGEFDVWHDRAVFHFLNDPDDRRRYVALAERTVRPGGTAVVATFAPDAPPTCSGLDVCRYDAEGLAQECGPGFSLIGTTSHVHTTPRGVRQPFQYSAFRRVVPAMVS